jgi:endo-1,4-beta-mannosidase
MKMKLYLAWLWICLGANRASAADNRAELIHTLPPLSVRGVNYFPRETPWSGLWTKTPAEVWEKDMALAAALGCNTVRTFVQFAPTLEQPGLLQRDGRPTPAYLGKIECLLTAASRHGIRLILCLEFSQQWLAAPDATDRWKRALTAVVGAHRDDGRVLLWDLMNEPDDDAKWTESTRAYLRAALPFLKELDPKHLTTVGITYRTDRLAEVGLPDVMQYHEYCPKAVLFEKGVTRVSQSIAGQRRTGGVRPLLLGEFGMSTARDPQRGAEESLRPKINDAPGTEAEQARLYEIVLTAAEKEHVAGVLAWCLHDYPIKNPNEAQFGLVRPDGSLKPAGLVLRDTYSRWTHP